MALTHSSKTKANEPDWGSVDKTKLPRNAHAEEGEAGKKSTWGYPHHWVENGKVGPDGVYVEGDMYLHRGGLNAAWAAAQGARSGQKASQSVISHLNAHRTDLGLNKKQGGTSEMEKLTKEEFVAAYPDLFAEITGEAYQRGLSEGKEKGKAEGLVSGAEAERNRIKDVESQMVPGHEAIIQEMKYDGKSTKADAAVRILAAEKTLRQTKLESFKEEHKTVAKDVTVQMIKKEEESAADANLPLEEKAKKEWEANASIRNEFRLGGFNSFVAWLKNKQNVRIMGKQ